MSHLGGGVKTQSLTFVTLFFSILKAFLNRYLLKFTSSFKRIDWKKHSFIKQDSDESEDEDLYFRQKTGQQSDQKPDQKSDQRVQVQQPDEIDTDDEINEVLDQKAKVVPEKVEPEKVEEEEVERIIRDNPKKADKKEVTITFLKAK